MPPIRLKDGANRTAELAGVSVEAVERAIRQHALDLLWVHLQPTVERVLKDKSMRTNMGTKVAALKLLWEIGRDRVVKVESKSLHANVDIQTLLERDPALRSYLEAHPDMKQKLLPAAGAS